MLYFELSKDELHSLYIVYDLKTDEDLTISSTASHIHVKAQTPHLKDNLCFFMLYSQTVEMEDNRFFAFSKTKPDLIKEKEIELDLYKLKNKDIEITIPKNSTLAKLYVIKNDNKQDN